MTKLVAFSCILVFVLLGSTESNDQFRVIGGALVKPKQFPFLVSLQYYGQHFCGGSIISESVILTAAHCLKGKSAYYLTVVAGTHNLFSGGVEKRAERITHHWGFTFEETDYDVGLVFLSSPLTFSDTIQKVKLPSASKDCHNNENYVIVTGWGATSAGGATTSTARYTNIPLWGRKTCLRYLPNLTRNMICAGSFDGQQNSCPGDSGGPLIEGDVQIGAVSYGYGCGAPGAPAVYSSLCDLRSWITQNAQV